MTDKRLLRGESHPNARLDAETVQHIRADIAEHRRLRELSALFTYDAIGKRHGCSGHRVRDIATGNAWGHLPWENDKLT